MFRDTHQRADFPSWRARRQPCPVPGKILGHAAEHMPPAHSAVAKRTPDWVRDEAAKVGVATAAYVERLLNGRDQSSKACGPAWASCAWDPHPVEHLEAACRRALAAGANSSGYVEQLLKSRRPLPDPRPMTVGLHDNLRGSGYYH